MLILSQKIKFNCLFIISIIYQLFTFIHLQNLQKNDIYFISTSKDLSLNQKFQIYGNEISNSEIQMKCDSMNNKNKITNNKRVKYNNFIFYLNFSTFRNCEIESINTHFVFSKNEKPILNFSEIIIIKKSIEYKEKQIKSPIELKDFYIQTSEYNSKIQLIKIINQQYIYSLENYNYSNNILLCKKRICFNLNSQLRKLQSNINFTFNHYYFVLNNANNDYPYEHKLIITPVEKSFSSDIFDQNGNYLEKKYNSTTNILSYELILSSKGEYTFYYIDNETGINNQINDTVKVVTDYTDLFKFTKIPDECNFGYYEIFLENIGIKNEHFGRINTKNRDFFHQFPTKFTGIYPVETFISYDLLIVENKDYEQYLFKKHITFTNYKLPSYQFYPNFTLTLSEIYCDISLMKDNIFLLNEKNKNYNSIRKIDCSNGLYDTNKNSINCRMNNEIYSKNGFYRLSLNDSNKDKFFFEQGSNSLIYISKSINESSFNYKIQNQQLIINDSYFYLPVIERIKVLFKDEEIITYTSDDFYIDMDYIPYIEIDLPQDKIFEDIIYIKRYNEEWEKNETDKNLYKIFKEDYFYDYLFILKTPLVIIKYHNNSYTYKSIKFEFDNINLAKEYQNQINNLKCEEPESNNLYCNFSNDINLSNSGKIDIQVINNSNIKKKIYTSILRFEGQNCQILSNMNTDINITIEYPNDCNINLFYSSIQFNCIIDPDFYYSEIQKQICILNKEDFTPGKYEISVSSECNGRNYNSNIDEMIYLFNQYDILVEDYFLNNDNLYEIIIYFNNEFNVDLEYFSQFYLNYDKKITIPSTEFKLIENNRINILFNLIDQPFGKYYLSYKTKCDNLIEPNITINTNEMQFNFDKIYIILNSETLFNYNPSYKEIKITPIINSDTKIEDLEGVYIKLESEYMLLNRENNTFKYQIKDGGIGVYEFSYRYIGKEKYNIPINQKVFVVYDFNELFIFSNINNCILNNNFQPIIIKNENYEYSNLVNLSEINILLEDTLFSKLYELNYNGYSFELNNEINNFDSSTMKDRFNFLFIYLNNKDYYLWKYNIDIYSIQTLNYKFYKDNIIIKGIYCNLKGLSIQKISNLTETYDLSCQKNIENSDSITCSAGNLKFINNINNPFYLLYFGKNITVNDSMNYIELNIYNSINDADFDLKIPEIILNDTNNIDINSNNFNLSEIDKIILHNLNIKETIECYKNNKLCDLINEDSLITITPKLNSEYNYNITIYRKINEFDTSSSIIYKTLNKKIGSRFEFKIDKSVLLIVNNIKGIITISTYGDEKNLIENIYYKITNISEFDDSKILKKENDKYILSDINETGNYEFAFSYQNSVKKYNTIYFNLTVFNKIENIFKIIDCYTKCILYNQSFKIKITLYDKLNLDFSVRLIQNDNKIKLSNELNSEIYEYNFREYGNNQLEGSYNLEIYDNSNENNVYYSISDIVVSDFNIINKYVYKDWIELNNVKCSFNKLGILAINTSSKNIMPLECENPLNNKIICKVSSISFYDFYSIYYDNYNTNEIIFISNTLFESQFSIIQPEVSEIINSGIITISISNIKNDFYMPFLSHVLIKSNNINTPDQLIDLYLEENSKSNIFSFNIYVQEQNTYSFYLYRKPIDGYYGNDNYILLNRTINVKGCPIKIYNNINIIKKSSDLPLIINITLNITGDRNTIDMNKIKIDGMNTKCKFNQINIICEYSLNQIEPRIIPITYLNWTNYFYIFSYESSGYYCKNYINSTITFQLKTHKLYDKTITFKYNSSIINCQNNTQNLNNIYYCLFNLISPKSDINISISTGNLIINQSLELTEMNTIIEGIQGELKEGYLFQQIQLISKNKLLEDELKQCTLSNGKDKEITSIPILNKNNLKLSTLYFSLFNYQYGSYILSCENKCNHKIEKNITIQKLICNPPLIRYVSNENNPSCKFCNITSEKNKLYQEGKCVEKCDSKNKYAVKLNDNNWCIQCDKTLLINDIETCINNCKSGFIEKNGECYLPDDPYLINDDINDDNKCSFCYPDHYISCDKDRCICKNNYYGLYCEVDHNFISIEEKLQYINNYVIDNDDFDFSNPYLVSEIKSILFLIENNNNYVPPTLTDTVKTYLNYTNITLNHLNHKNIINMFYFNQLSLFLNLYYINNNNLRQLSESEKYIREILNNAVYINKKGAMESKLPSIGYKIYSDNLKLISYIWYRRNATDKVMEYLKNYTNNTLSFINLTECLNEDDVVILTITPNNILSYVDDLYTKDSLGINFNVSLNNSDIDLLTKCKYINYQLYISSSLLKYNQTKYKYYKKRGINIYDKNDISFNDICFKSNNFNYDLTYNYRRFEVYENLTYNSEYCKFYSIDEDTSRVIFNCTGDQHSNIIIKAHYDPFINKTYYNLPIKCKNNVGNLSNNNAFMFYLILIIVFFISLGINIYLICITNEEDEENNKNIPNNPPGKNNSKEMIENDDEKQNEKEDKIESSDDKNLNESDSEVIDIHNNVIEGVNIKKMNSKKTTISHSNLAATKISNSINNSIEEIAAENVDYVGSINEQKKEEKDNNLYSKSIKMTSIKVLQSQHHPENVVDDIIKLNELNQSVYLLPKIKYLLINFVSNFLQLHPILSLIKHPIINSLFLIHVIFIFNIASIFGFNAILLNEKKIEKRIFDNDRDKINYPFKKEFGTMILSIIITASLNVFFRLIILTSFGQRFDSEEDGNYKCNELTVRNIYAAFLMLGCILFFMIYSIFWCAIFYNSQLGWLIMGFCCLFFNWLILSPIYISIISILETFFENKRCIYYMKVLFIF